MIICSLRLVLRVPFFVTDQGTCNYDKLSTLSWQLHIPTSFRNRLSCAFPLPARLQCSIVIISIQIYLKIHLPWLHKVFSVTAILPQCHDIFHGRRQISFLLRQCRNEAAVYKDQASRRGRGLLGPKPAIGARTKTRVFSTWRNQKVAVHRATKKYLVWD